MSLRISVKLDTDEKSVKMARLSLVLFICFLFIGVYVNSRVLKSEATRMPNGDSMHDDELMELLNGSINDGDNPLQMQSLDRDTEDKKCAQVGEFVSNSFVFD